MTDCFAGDRRTNREWMLAGDWYIADDPENARRAQGAVPLAERYRVASIEDERAALPILAELIGDLGEDAFIKSPLYVDYGDHITIGARMSVNSDLTSRRSGSGTTVRSVRTCSC